MSEELKRLIELFKQKYGVGFEVKLPRPIMTIFDNYPSPFSSGSCGYMKKLRIDPETEEFQYYHDWWAYGWNEYDEYMEKHGVDALNQVL